MRLAFAVDFLLERTHEVFLLELLLAGFPDAEIYTLAHAPGKILGRIETHRITSTPLSKMVASSADLPARAWMLPTLVRQLKVSPEIDKLIVLSSGWAHLIGSHPRTERFVWAFDFDPPALRLKGWKRVFQGYHRELKLRALRSEQNLALASQGLAQLVGRSEKLIAPALKTEEYPLVPDEQHPGLYPYHLVLLTNAPEGRIRELVRIARAQKTPLRFVGRDEAYADLKALNDPELEFIGDHCAATTAALTHQARAVWSLALAVFPADALGALCCGRPVVVPELAHYREVLPAEGVWYDTGDLAELFVRVNRDYLSPDKKLLRRAGLRYNERLFKNQLRIWANIKPTKAED